MLTYMPRGLARFVKYSSVGCSTFAFDLVLLYLLIDYAQVPYIYATALAFLVAISIHYVVSRRYVFQGTLRQAHSGYAIFVVIAFGGLLLVTGGMYVMVEYAHVQPLLARVAVAGVVGFWNYLMNLYVNFRVAGLHGVVVHSRGDDE